MIGSIYQNPKLWKERIVSALSFLSNLDQQRASWTSGSPYFPDPIELCATLLDDNQFEEFLTRQVEVGGENLYQERLRRDGRELIKKITRYPAEKLRDVRKVLTDPEWEQICRLSASIRNRLQE